MLFLRDLRAVSAQIQGGAVTVGNFDGVHLGHAHLVGELVKRARGKKVPSVVLTFDPHPVCLLRPEAAPPLLTWTERKVALLAALGIDVVIAYPTDKDLLELEPEDFFFRVLRQLLHARLVVEGPNFFFGRHRQGDIRLLRRLCEQAGMELHVVEPLECDGQVVSSSRIRELIRQGEMGTVARLLTEPYRIRGQVVRGMGRGHSLGFATANLTHIDTLLPAAGVYAGRGYVRGRSYAAAVHIGANPTFGEWTHKVEVHLLDFQGELEGESLEVDFLARLRNTCSFASAADLQAQLARDVRATADIVAAYQGSRS